jgi:hypothetical protein
MSVSPVLMFPPSTESQDEKAAVSLPQGAPQPVSGNDPSRQTDKTPIYRSPSSAPQEEVKVQMEPPGEIAVYQFLNQDGTLVLQVPPQQWLNLAHDISKELAQESAPKPAVAAEKGENHGR